MLSALSASVKPSGSSMITSPSVDGFQVPSQSFSAKSASMTPFRTTKRSPSFANRRAAKTRPVSAALMARLTLIELSAVRRLPWATIAIAMPSDPKITRNIIASTDATPRRRRASRRTDFID
mgnify:CR=1 FL=1